jgi:hypothetical protein
MLLAAVVLRNIYLQAANDSTKGVLLKCLTHNCQPPMTQLLTCLQAANDFDEDVLLKWSLHPTVGQRLMSGNWLNELALPEELKALYAQAQVPEFMAALNFDVQQQQQQQ